MRWRSHQPSHAGNKGPPSFTLPMSIIWRQYNDLQVCLIPRQYHLRLCLHGNISLIYVPHLWERTEVLCSGASKHLVILPYVICLLILCLFIILSLFILTGSYYGQMFRITKLSLAIFIFTHCKISTRNYKNYVRSKINIFLWLLSWHSLFFQCHFWTASLEAKAEYWMMWFWQPLIRNRWHVYLQRCRWLNLTQLYRRDADATLTQLMEEEEEKKI